MTAKTTYTNSRLMGETFTIGMGEYAYLNQQTVEETGVTSLQTPAVTSCYGTVFYDTGTGDVAIAHFDINKIEQMNYAIQDILENTEGSYDTVHFYTNKDIERLEDTERELEDLREVLEVTPETDVTTHINDKAKELKVEHSQGITQANIDKTQIDRLNTPLQIKNKKAQKTDEIIYNPLN